MANQPIKSVKKDDTVQVIAGKFKGQSGKVLEVSAKKGMVKIEGLGVVTRHIRPSQVNPRGGTKEVHIGLDVSKVKKVESTKKVESKPAKSPAATKESK